MWSRVNILYASKAVREPGTLAPPDHAAWKGFWKIPQKDTRAREGERTRLKKK